MSRSVIINGTTYQGELNGPWPEDPIRGYKRQGSTFQCIPGSSGAGNFIHVDYGLVESSGECEVWLSRITRSNLIAIMNHYKTAGSTTLTVQTLDGNRFECVYRPNTIAVQPKQHPGFEGEYSVRILVNIIQKLVSGTLP